MKKTFRVFAVSATYSYIDIEADTAEEAEEIAMNADGGDFISTQDGSFDVAPDGCPTKEVVDGKEVDNPSLIKISVRDEMKVISIYFTEVNPETYQYLQRHAIYTDSVLTEHLIDVSVIVD